MGRDGETGGSAGIEHVDVTREVVIGDRTVRVRASYRDTTGVAVELVIEDSGGQRCGHLTGTVAPSDLRTASDALGSLFGAVAVVLGQPKVAKGSDFEELRRRYPNAYKSWTAAEEARLIDRYRTESDLNALAREFGRRPSGLARRLERLNLRPPSDRQPEPGHEPDDEEPEWR